MVLTTKIKTIIIIFVLIVKTSTLFAESISTLVQYGKNIDKERLILMEDKQIIRFVNESQDIRGIPYNEIINKNNGIYKIRNTGNEYKATVGILISGLQSRPSPEEFDLHFFINGVPVKYYKIENYASVNFGEEKIRLEQTSTCWALIDVTFPKNSIITIEVQYINILGYSGTNTEYFQGMFYWRGETKFSVEIINDSISNNYVEKHWISNITFLFKKGYDWEKYSFRTAKYLITLQSMENSLINIQRKNGNAFIIEFKEEFYKYYDRSYFFNCEEWLQEKGAYLYFIRDEYIPKEGAYRYFEPEIVLGFLDGDFRYDKEYANICRRLLGPYELIFLTDNQLRIMRNAFYARHGYIFNSNELQSMFEIVFNYKPNPNFKESMLTDIDRANIEIIKRLEALK